MKTSREPLIEHIFDYDVIVVPMSIDNSMSRGFASEVRSSFNGIKDEEEKTNYCDRRKYGTIYPIVISGVTFCMSYMHSGGNPKNADGTFCYPDKIESCLHHIRDRYGKKRIGMTLIGTSDYDGKLPEEESLSIIEKAMNGTDCTVHMFEQRNPKSDTFRKMAELHREYSERNISKEEYERKYSEQVWIRDHGIYEDMPEGFSVFKGWKDSGLINVNRDMVPFVVSNPAEKDKYKTRYKNKGKKRWQKTRRY